METGQNFFHLHTHIHTRQFQWIIIIISMKKHAILVVHYLKADPHEDVPKHSQFVPQNRSYRFDLSMSKPCTYIYIYYGQGKHGKTIVGWWFHYPSEKSWSSSVGMMKFPSEWKKIKHVPNHQLATNLSPTR